MRIRLIILLCALSLAALSLAAVAAACEEAQDVGCCPSERADAGEEPAPAEGDCEGSGCAGCSQPCCAGLAGLITATAAAPRATSRFNRSARSLLHTAADPHGIDHPPRR